MKHEAQIEIEKDEFEKTETFSVPKRYPEHFRLDTIKQEFILSESSFQSGSQQTNGRFFEEELLFTERKSCEDQPQPRGDPSLWNPLGIK